MEVSHLAAVLHPVDDDLEVRPLGDGKPALANDVGLRIAADRDVVDTPAVDAPHLEHLLDRLRRKPRDVLDPAKPLLLHRRYELPVLDEDSRDVAVKSVDA